MSNAADRSDIVRLPSGIVIDLYDFNVRACQTSDDAFELLQAIQEKIIDIEFQLECYEIGRHPSGRPYSPSDPLDPMWAPKANKALAWSKLQKADAQHRFQRLSKAENEARYRELNRAFVEEARRVLDEELFKRIMARATGDKAETAA